MLNKKKVSLVILLIVTWLGGCTEPTEDTARENTSAPASASVISKGGVSKGGADEDMMAHMRGQEGGGEAHPGARIYQDHCAQCHSQAVARAPHKSFLEMLNPKLILTALEEGIMQQQASHLSLEEKKQVAEFLTGSQSGKQSFPYVHCEGDALEFDMSQPPLAKGWGFDRENTRFIPASVAGLEKSDIPNLKLKWAFAYPGKTRARSQPSLAAGALFVGSQDGTVYALDAESGCVRWTFSARAEVRTGVTIMPWDPGKPPEDAPLVFFSDLLARTYAVNMLTGELAWEHKLDEHPNATATGQPLYYGNRVYSPVSSLEEVPAADPTYECCTFRGSIVAMDAMSGERLWKSHTIREESRAVGVNSEGTTIFAPSGAPVFNSPTIDVERQLIFAGTGNNYSSPSDGTSDAVLAMNLENGNIEWLKQVTSKDAWNIACFDFVPNRAGCPEEKGPDVDFISPPILVKQGDREILVAGQKSGDVWGISPVTKDIVWHQKVGRGGNQGGINFGMAAMDGSVFVPMADFDDGELSMADARPGLYALDAFTGERRWDHMAENQCNDKKDCDPGISAPVTAIPGAVLAGHLDGRIRAYSVDDGRIIWEFNSDREFTTISGEIARGGSISGGSGPVIADGMVYVNSGYGLYFHMPGNVLLAFTVDN